MKIKYIIFLFLAVMLSGCYTDFEPDLDSTPVVCINAKAKVGEEFIINVTHTWRWSAEDRFASHDIKDAEVILYVNDEEVERPVYSKWVITDYWDPWHTEDSGYKTTYIPKPGDKIKVMVHSVEYGDAEGETTVPYPVSIEDVTITPKITKEEFTQHYNYWDENGEYKEKNVEVVQYRGSASFSIPFTDPAGVTNYYYVTAGVSNDWDSDYYTSGYVNFDSEPLFTEHVSSLESAVSETSGYTFFSDRMISGKTYPLHLRIENLVYTVPKDGGFEDNEAYATFTLNSISESYYRHVISVWESNDGINGVLGDVGLSDPVWECSNVSTGAGVISAIALSTLKIPMSEIVSK